MMDLQPPIVAGRMVWSGPIKRQPDGWPRLGAGAKLNLRCQPSHVARAETDRLGKDSLGDLQLDGAEGEPSARFYFGAPQDPGARRKVRGIVGHVSRSLERLRTWLPHVCREKKNQEAKSFSIDN
jgi:hypothetical protein